MCVGTMNIYVDWELLSDERKELIEQIAHGIKRTIAAGVGFRLYLRTYRTYVLPLPIKRGGFIYASDIGTDAGAERRETLPLDILHAGRLLPQIYGDIPPNAPKNYEQPFNIAHGGFFEREISGFYQCGGLEVERRVERESVVVSAHQIYRPCVFIVEFFALGCQQVFDRYTDIKTPRYLVIKTCG